MEEAFDTIAFGDTDRVRVVFDEDSGAEAFSPRHWSCSVAAIALEGQVTALTIGDDFPEHLQLIAGGVEVLLDDLRNKWEIDSTTDDIETALVKHCKRAGYLAEVVTVRGNVQGDEVRALWIANNDSVWWPTLQAQQALIASEVEVFGQWYTGQVFGMLHERLEVWRNVQTSEERTEWTEVDAIWDIYIGANEDIAELARYHFDLPAKVA